MSLWVVEREGNEMRLLFTDSALAGADTFQHCGGGEAILASEVEAFACEQAEPWDLVRTPRGTFVRLGPAKAAQPA